MKTLDCRMRAIRIGLSLLSCVTYVQICLGKDSVHFLHGSHPTSDSEGLAHDKHAAPSTRKNAIRLFHCVGITSGIQYNLPNCLNTVQPGASCGESTGISGTCCPIGFSCNSPADGGTPFCEANISPSYSFAGPSCRILLPIGQPCGERQNGISL